jgi:hypothetical protein
MRGGGSQNESNGANERRKGGCAVQPHPSADQCRKPVEIHGTAATMISPTINAAM